MTIIGGADGPTSIFIAGRMGWLNWFGLILMALIMIPNILWAIRGRASKCKSRVMSLLEQIGRYGCMFLMVFNVGVSEFGFPGPVNFIVYLAGNTVLLTLYFVFWIVYAKKPGGFPALMLALLPVLIFLLCGVTLRHWLLVGFAALFGAAHIFITICNIKENGNV